MSTYMAATLFPPTRVPVLSQGRTQRSKHHRNSLTHSHTICKPEQLPTILWNFLRPMCTKIIIPLTIDGKENDPEQYTSYSAYQELDHRSLPDCTLSCTHPGPAHSPNTREYDSSGMFKTRCSSMKHFFHPTNVDECQWPSKRGGSISTFDPAQSCLMRRISSLRSPSKSKRTDTTQFSK